MSPKSPFYRVFTVVLLLILATVACSFGEDSSSTTSNTTSSSAATQAPVAPDNAITISIIYAPESEAYLPEAIQNFNRAYAEGRNPITGERLADGEKPIFVEGRNASSGTVMQGIVNAIIAPNNQNVEKPTIFAPSVSHWLALANYQSGRELFDLTNSPATANAPVVMAIWESRLQAIQDANPGEQIGWSHLLEVLNNPEGWGAYGISGRKTVYYGHTDPFISSTAISTLIAEYYASAQANGIVERRLSMETVQNLDVQQGVRDIENLIRHYSSRTTEFKEYIAQGPDYLDFVALEENDLIYINQGKTQYNPPEKLIALYPAEGTFWHEHPFGIVQADWVTPEMAEAARIFTDYVLTPSVQEKVLAAGFRPVNPDVELGYPITPELGVDPAQPFTVLEVPEPAVISAVQESWSFVKKQADIWLLMDVSGSMEGEKLNLAKDAAIAFLDQTESNNRVGLMIFSTGVEIVVPIDNIESNRDRLEESIQGLDADGDTALYDAIIETITAMNETSEDGDRIRAIVLLSDGEDTASTQALNSVNTLLQGERSKQNPIIVIPVAYGDSADVRSLSSIARASATRVQSGAPENIRSVLEVISSYF